MPANRVSKKLKIIKGTGNVTKDIRNPMDLPELAQIPECPEELSRLDKGPQIWNDQVTDLFNLDMLHASDLQQLISYCVEMCLYWDCIDAIFEKGATYETKDSKGNTLQKVPIPEVRMSNQHLSNASKLAKEFGFSPSSRSGISMPHGAGKPVDPLKALKEKYK